MSEYISRADTGNISYGQYMAQKRDRILAKRRRK